MFLTKLFSFRFKLEPMMAYGFFFARTDFRKLVEPRFCDTFACFRSAPKSWENPSNSGVRAFWPAPEMRKLVEPVRVCQKLAHKNVGAIFRVRVSQTWHFDTKGDGEGETEGGRRRGRGRLRSPPWRGRAKMDKREPQWTRLEPEWIRIHIN